MAAAAPDLDAQVNQVLSEVRTEIDVARRHRIFCNRNLRMDQVEMIGFDMDYTLALYHQARMERLSIELTLTKLIDGRGYPEEIRHLNYEPQWAIRGLMVDRKLGNVFKLDRHSHVGRCYHGTRKLTPDERKQFYRFEKINFSDDRYEWIDTLFGLPEVVMYITMVDWLEAKGPVPEGGYDKMFGDIRLSIDEAHRDDTLKSVIKKELPEYVVKDPDLAETLHKLRSSGKRLFLLTNSLYDYTDVVMKYLLDGARMPYPSWRNYFDYVIVGGQKPVFFNEQKPFVAIDPHTGRQLPGDVKTLSRDKVYQGGNIVAFEQMTNVRGENCLYVGDHIYGDILRLRKGYMWRTAMIIQELDMELGVGERLDGQLRDMELLDRRRRNLESEIDFQALRLKRMQRLLDEANAAAATATATAAATPPGTPLSAPLRARLEEAKRQTKAALDSLRDRARLMAEEVELLEEATERAFNGYWGSVLREGNENSRFGEQCGDYADLYTSRVSNFLSYSPLRYFRAPRRAMPHEI
ncbi:MAG TPA: HAD-IG family 5'-nucleotidase [Kofleriaceae bacterium]|nr:HAD-IG family 5'-nucleotidase [Kofleriaceae bacterium]